MHAIRLGMLHLFIKHTSASLTINENADPSVRVDMERHFKCSRARRAQYYTQDTEGSDDMPAHIKVSILGSSVLIPLRMEAGIGTWQEIHLCEHRDSGGAGVSWRRSGGSEDLNDK